ncbi:transposase [Clostridium sp. WILCCON 0269]|uniref:Transposase n=1 Tax=Candidatus Clostridium eludens TaxID=3381663 RepID=A0ABW8SID6_9CLOT
MGIPLFMCIFTIGRIKRYTCNNGANLSSKTKTTVSSQALDQHLNEKAVKFLKEIFTRLLNSVTLTNSNIPTIWDEHFSRIRIVDSTAFQVPTNISNDILIAKQIHDIYSLRWQVELIFKIWKPIFHISSVKPVKIERFKCQLYGKLILLVLSSIVMFKMRSELLKKKKFETSEIKTAQIVHEYVQELYFSFMTP